MKVSFRVDASVYMGFGHLMRCLTLAEALREHGAQVLFICREHKGHLIPLLQQKGIPVTVLPAPIMSNITPGEDYSVWLGVTQDEDAAQTVEALRSSKFDRPDWLIVDHYGLDIEWEQRLRPHIHKLMVIDDLANRHHQCDVLLDQNYSIKGEQRYADLMPGACKLLVGPHYALLRPEYAAYRRTLRTRNGQLKRVLVFFGGSDPQNMTGLALEALSQAELSHLEVDVVVGANSPYREIVEKQAAARPQTTIHGNLPHLADLMVQADLAMGAGGATTWERMCLGLPAIVVSIADNQKPASEALAAAQLIYYAGHFSDVEADYLVQQIQKLRHDPIGLVALSTQNQLQVDGLGALRVVEILYPKAFSKVPTVGFSIAILSDQDSWLNSAIQKMLQDWRTEEHQVLWVHNIEDLQPGDFCFYLGCGQIVPPTILSQYRNNLVVHESELPKGKGWSPLTWQILEAKNRIAVTLFEAADKVDSGVIYAQEWLEFEGHELIEELRAAQAQATLQLCKRFVTHYPQILEGAREQVGEPTFYPRRCPEDSTLNPAQSIEAQFDLLRVVDNQRYPAFFEIRGHRYVLKIEKVEKL